MGLFIGRSDNAALSAMCGPTGRIPMARVADAVLRGYAAEGRSDVHRWRIRSVLEILVKGAGVSWADQLDGNAIDRFDFIVSARGVRNRANYMSALHAVCVRIAAMGLIGRMPPFPDFPNPCRLPASDRHIVYLTPDDVNRVLDRRRTAAQTWEGHRDFVLIALPATTGLLRREALTLRIEDVDLTRRIIRVRRREGLARSKFPSLVMIPGPLVEILTGWLPRTGCEWVFPGVTRVGPWTDGAPGRKAVDRLRSAGLDAGVAGMTFEALRRFAEMHDPESLHLDPPPAGPVPLTPAWKRVANRYNLTSAESIGLMTYLRDRSASWEGHRVFAASAMPLLQGLRRREVLYLRTTDIDFDRGLLAVPGRTIPVVLVPDAAEILRGWFRRPDRGDSPFVFPGARLMGPWIGGSRRSKFTNQLADAGEAAGVSGRVNVDRLWQTWRAHHGRIDLGNAWRTGIAPTPELTGPQPGRPGPQPTQPRGRGTRRADRDSRPDLAMWDPWTVVSVIKIGRPGEPVYIDGKEKPPLRAAQHAVISALLNAGPEGLDEQELREKSGRGGWWRILKELGKDPDWGRILMFPGGPWGRYRILAEREPAA